MKTETKKQTAADAIRALAEKHGGITAEIVLKAAEKKTSPLHPHFDWDDTAAARKYRLVQAGELIRKIKVTYDVSPEHHVRVRAFHNVTDDSPDGATGCFVTLDTALSVESYRDQMLANCKRDMQAFRQKYAALTEVANVIAAMDNVA
jgi:hypothetical protein